MRLMHLLLVSVSSMLLSFSSITATEPTDWPQFRGPGGLGVSSAKLPIKWGPKENVLWKTAMPGPGTSSPIVIGNKIFLTCYSGYLVPGKSAASIDELKLHLLCLDRDSGKIQWTKNVTPELPEQATIRDDHGYASSTPASDGERVYTFFGKTGVFAFDLDGKELWKAKVGSELNGWGSAASPIVVGDLLIVNASVESQSLIALDKRTGKEVWKVKGINEAWNTPLLVQLKEGKKELVVAMPGKILGFDPKNGEKLWSCANEITWYIVPTIVENEGTIWSIGGRSGVAAVAVKAGGRGDVTKTHRLWTGNHGSNVSSPIIHKGHLYWMHDNLGVAFCAQADTGKIVWEERISRADQIYASPVLADDKLYFTSRSGQTYVIAANPKYELMSTNNLGERGTFNASAAITGNRLLIRSNAFLYCIGEK